MIRPKKRRSRLCVQHRFPRGHNRHINNKKLSSGARGNPFYFLFSVLCSLLQGLSPRMRENPSLGRHMIIILAKHQKTMIGPEFVVFFNLIPIFPFTPFNGRRIFLWNKTLWTLLVIWLILLLGVKTFL